MRAAFAFLAVLPLGCSGSSGSSVGIADVGVEETTDVGNEVATCGTNVGDTLCNLDLQGYVRDATDGLASAATPGAFKVSEALAIGKQRYAFIFNTAYW